MRLNRFLASAGLGSRRSVEEIIKSGRVKINGRPVTDLATQVGPEDSVKVGTKVVHAEQTLTAVLYKPRGYLCTADDELERRTIFELLPEGWPRVFHVGRLDKESEGLLIVTNDGDLSLALTHPSHQIEKEYEVGIDKPFDSEHREKLLKGIRIEGGLAKAEYVNVVTPQLLKLTLRQGIKRQIRLMCYTLGYEVTHLRRIRVGPLRIGAMRPGEWRILNDKEIAALKASKPVPRPPRPPRPASATAAPSKPRAIKRTRPTAEMRRQEHRSPKPSPESI
ncbi:MAG: rsuA [Chthoniobacteraceae bacterium]|nr:rsuA [Chthoniobacteraceae bacterium]